MNRDIVQWSEVMKMPLPEWTLTILWQTVIHFWRAEIDPQFYECHKFPTNVKSIQLEVDHKMNLKSRYHVFCLTDTDTAGLWDETPFWVSWDKIDEPAPSFLEHGDYRHPFQLFLKSFLRATRRHAKHYPTLQLAHKVIMKMPTLTWRCHVCEKYEQWSRHFIENELIHHEVSISATTLLFLLSHDNPKLRKQEKIHPSMVNQLGDLCEMLSMALHRFFVDFEKIYEQTSLDPTIILKNLIAVLKKFPYPIEEIQSFEQACAKDMRMYLLDQFKFLRTKSIGINHFPRDLLIARDLFSTIVHIWSRKKDGAQTSPGTMMLMNYLLFRDGAMGKDLRSIPPLLVIHPIDDSKPCSIRHMTPPETDILQDYHPILRPTLFDAEVDTEEL